MKFSLFAEDEVPMVAFSDGKSHFLERLKRRLGVPRVEHQRTIGREALQFGHETGAAGVELDQQTIQLRGFIWFNLCMTIILRLHHFKNVIFEAIKFFSTVKGATAICIIF
jgi:hypothetical protein